MQRVVAQGIGSSTKGKKTQSTREKENEGKVEKVMAITTAPFCYAPWQHMNNANHTLSQICP